MVLKLPPASMAIIVMAMAMVMAMVMVTVATILLTRRDNVVSIYKENPAANIAAGFFLQPSLAVDEIKESGQIRPQTRTYGRTLGAAIDGCDRDTIS